MTTICAWCKKTMSGDGSDPVSHTICPACTAQQMRDVKRIQDERRQSAERQAKAYFDNAPNGD